MKELKIGIKDWFIADIIGAGIYQMVECGVNHVGNYYIIVRLKKLFNKGFAHRNHETTCHPIVDFERWNNFKIIKPHPLKHK